MSDFHRAFSLHEPAHGAYMPQCRLSTARSGISATCRIQWIHRHLAGTRVCGVRPVPPPPPAHPKRLPNPPGSTYDRALNGNA
eukprot:5137365-Pleurochrysis_carterae.AAC.1